MPILVTGGCGFVGINIAEELAARGERIVLFDRIPLPDSANRDLRAHSARITVVTGDVRDDRLLASVFADHAIDCVIHTAAITADAGRESRSAGEILAVNVNGTVCVLEAARSAGCRRIVYVGSGAAYGAIHDSGMLLKEASSASAPQDIYGISKFAAERTALRLCELWRIDIVCVRLGSVCGPWEFATGVRDLLSPQLQVAQLALRGERAIIPAHEFWRDWVYSRDVATGIALLATAGTAAAGARAPMYHLSSGIDWQGTFPDWCNLLGKRFPPFAWQTAAPGERPNVTFVVDRDRAPMDITRIADDFGFKARFDPASAYRDYAEWIDRHREFIAC